MTAYKFNGLADEVSTFPLRSIGAARRRVAVARLKAARFPSEENDLAAAELQAGLDRMENASAVTV
ncbi:hypothetical protein AHiyo6_04040 [Arthrobacter sp. Hiyo6]|nr:hypothetical protein AHiyo6_04040 [Arthrobacter sp. Hiyo6]